MSAPRTLGPDPRAEWGTPQSFRCAICDNESTGPAGTLAPPGAPRGLRMAVCRPCGGRWADSAGFRRDNAARLLDAAQRGFRRRVADVFGIPAEAIFGHSDPAAAAAALGVTPERMRAAFREALGGAR